MNLLFFSTFWFRILSFLNLSPDSPDYFFFNVPKTALASARTTFNPTDKAIVYVKKHQLSEFIFLLLFTI